MKTILTRYQMPHLTLGLPVIVNRRKWIEIGKRGFGKALLGLRTAVIRYDNGLRYRLELELFRRSFNFYVLRIHKLISSEPA